jgi:phenylpropionate dioxygenase-like ring-hydroxylating dioxygenase large terminal subunit
MPCYFLLRLLCVRVLLRLLGSRVVSYRDEASGQVYCLDDTCEHR